MSAHYRIIYNEDFMEMSSGEIKKGKGSGRNLTPSEQREVESLFFKGGLLQPVAQSVVLDSRARELDEERKKLKKEINSIKGRIEITKKRIKEVFGNDYKIEDIELGKSEAVAFIKLSHKFYLLYLKYTDITGGKGYICDVYLGDSEKEVEALFEWYKKSLKGN